MKTIIMVACLTAVITFNVSQTLAGEREIAGALIGAGTGAVLGHVVGGNAESAIIGTFLGGIVGVSVGHIGNRDRISLHPDTYHYSTRNHSYTGKKHYRRYSTHGNIRSCRIEKYITYKHGRKYIVKESICRGDSPYRHQRYLHPYGYRDFGNRDYGKRGYGNRGYGYRGYGHHGYGDWRSKQRDWRR